MANTKVPNEFLEDNLVVAGDLTVDTSTLVVDSTNNRVGIGTATNDSGIKLDVRGNVRIGDGSTVEQDIHFESANGSWQVGSNDSGNGTSGNQFYIYDTNRPAYSLTVQRGGKVGINTSSPSELLSVDAGALWIGATYGTSGAGELVQKFVDRNNTTYGWETNLETSAHGNLDLGRLVNGTRTSVITYARSSGDVHIGQSDSDVRLYFGSTGGAFGGNSSMNIRGTSDQLMYNVGGTGSRHVWEINGTERMRIVTDSNYLHPKVGIGTSNPTAQLHIDATGSQQNTSDAHVYINKNSSGDWSLWLAAGADNYGLYTLGNGGHAILVKNQPSNADRARINYDGQIYLNGGSSAVFNINSDERLKEEISNAPSQWQLIKDLPLKRFKWIDRRDGDKWSYGFIAQEVEINYPEFVELVPQSKEDIDAGVEDPEYKTVAEGQIHERALAALQEAMERIEQLEARIETLENS